MNEEQHTENSAPHTPPQGAAKASLKSNIGVPLAIVVGALCIAAAIVYAGSHRSGNPIQVGNNVQQVAKTGDVAPVTEKDHIRGNPNAPIMIVEYSDYDCPYCRVFYDTMVKIIEKYGADGKVAWVYRHYPIAQLHPNAHKIVEASYCVSELGGNEAFWKFNDALNNSRKVEYSADGRLKSVEPTDMGKMSQFVATAGVDKTAFESCFSSGKYAEQANKDVVEATKAGAQGTPYSVLIAGDQQGPIDGALPFETIVQMIDSVLTQMGSL